MKDGKTGKLARWLSCCLAMTAMVVLAIGLNPWYGRLVARHWQDEWATVRDEEATDLAERIAALGTPGIGALVAGMGSQRESVVDAARWVLCREVDDWERLPAGEASVRLALLIESLAAQSEQFSPPARVTAADLAVRVLLWPTENAVVERSRLVADCACVLKASGDRTAGHVAHQKLIPHRAAARRGPVQLASFDEPARATRSVAERIGRRLPSGLVEAQPLERATSGDTAPLWAEGTPRRLALDPAARRLVSTGRPPSSDEVSPSQAAEAVVVTAGADDDSPERHVERISGRIGHSETP
ncbi:MAG TPA: hypothetical protein VMV69_22470 [Pirellulales bacterium]|nr:hypothetical protein [Pirellulales bacterium]